MDFSIENLKKIVVENLLFQNHYEIDLERLTILHGYNGSGKTTLLGIIHSLLNKNYSITLNYIFNSISFVFEKGNVIEFIRESEKSLKCYIYDDKSDLLSESKLIKKFEDFEEVTRHMSGAKLQEIFNSLPNLRARDSDDDFPYVDGNTGEYISRDEAIDYLRTLRFYDFDPSIEEYISGLQSYFIQTNRLESIESIKGLTGRKERYLRRQYKRAYSVRNEFLDRRRKRKFTEDPMRFIQNDLRERIEKSAENSAKIGREFDSKFFDLLIDEVKSETQIKFENKMSILEEDLIRIDEEEEDLSRLGLYEGPATETQRAKKVLKEEKETIIKLINAATVFSQGLQKKFEVYNDLKRKVAKFTEFLGSHLLGKELKASREKGFQFKTKDQIIIEPWNLSSGEQHIVLVAYFLIFLAPSKSMILIDEPEISLHLDWQETFLDDVLKISEESQLRFLIATHSPAIISHYRGNMVKLGSSV